MNRLQQFVELFRYAKMLAKFTDNLYGHGVKVKESYLNTVQR